MQDILVVFFLFFYVLCFICKRCNKDVSIGCYWISFWQKMRSIITGMFVDSKTCILLSLAYVCTGLT